MYDMRSCLLRDTSENLFIQRREKCNRWISPIIVLEFIDDEEPLIIIYSFIDDEELCDIRHMIFVKNVID